MIKRVVIDTNVFISASLSPKSSTAFVVDWSFYNAQILFSTQTFYELKTRLYRSKFDRYLDDANREHLLGKLLDVAVWIEQSSEKTLKSYNRDPKDDKFFELAIMGKADWLISGDRDVLEAPSPKHFSVMSPKEAVGKIASLG